MAASNNPVEEALAAIIYTSLAAMNAGPNTFFHLSNYCLTLNLAIVATCGEQMPGAASDDLPPAKPHG